MSFKILSRVIYGTHLATTEQRERLKITPAVLHDHRRHRVNNMDYPGVIPFSGASVRGTIVTGLSEMDIARLDYFEGTEYDRQELDVNVLVEGPNGVTEGRTIKANVYIWVEGDVFLEEEEWDFARFVKERQTCWLGEGDVIFTEADGVDFYDGKCMNPVGKRQPSPLLGMTPAISRESTPPPM